MVDAEGMARAHAGPTWMMVEKALADSGKTLRLAAHRVRAPGAAQVVTTVRVSYSVGGIQLRS